MVFCRIAQNFQVLNKMINRFEEKDDKSFLNLNQKLLLKTQVISED